MIEWLTDKVLLRVPRQQAPVLIAEVDEPAVPHPGRLLQRARPAHGRRVDGGHRPARRARASSDMTDALTAAGVGPHMVNTRQFGDIAALQRPRPAAVDAAREHLEARRAEYDAKVNGPIEEYRARLAHLGAAQPRRPRTPSQRSKREQVSETAKELRRLTEALRTAGEPLLRVLAVLSPRRRRAPDELRLDHQPRRLPLPALPGRGAAPRPGEAGQPAHPLGRAGEGEASRPRSRDCAACAASTSTRACRSRTRRPRSFGTDQEQEKSK